MHGGENTLYVVAISAATPSDARGIQAMYWLRNIRAGLEEDVRGQVVIVITHKDLVDQATVDKVDEWTKDLIDDVSTVYYCIRPFCYTCATTY